MNLNQLKEWHETTEKIANKKIHFSERLLDQNLRHVMGISGGKDSAALAIHIKDKYPELHSKMEYFFCDTSAELPETYAFITKLEKYLGKKVAMLGRERDWEDWLKYHHNYLPSVRARWCTVKMKLIPMERFIGKGQVISYVGIRADENRKAYISHKKNIKAVYPLAEDGLVRKDVFDMLERTVGIPEYYKWRSRSGCYFCFFQRQSEWLGLKRNHPELFEKAKTYEKEGFTWTGRGTLDDVIERAELAELKGKLKPEKDRLKVTWEVMLKKAPDELDEIIKRAEKDRIEITWKEKMKNTPDEHESDRSCAVCSI